MRMKRERAKKKFLLVSQQNGLEFRFNIRSILNWLFSPGDHILNPFSRGRNSSSQSTIIFFEPPPHTCTHTPTSHYYNPSIRIRWMQESELIWYYSLLFFGGEEGNGTCQGLSQSIDNFPSSPLVSNTHSRSLFLKQKKLYCFPARDLCFVAKTEAFW